MPPRHPPRPGIMRRIETAALRWLLPRLAARHEYRNDGRSSPVVDCTVYLRETWAEEVTQ